MSTSAHVRAARRPARDELLERIFRDPRLPSPPAVALRVLDLANRAECSIKELGQVITLDPSLCGKFLRLANSSLHAVAQPVTSINRALQMLGLRRVRTLVLGLSLPSLRFRSPSSEHVRDFLREALVRAVAARELAARRTGSDPDTEMIAALLCDVGSLLLHEALPQEYQAFLAEPAELRALDPCALEEAHLGISHAEVGAEVLARWGLPAEVTEAIRHHHAPNRVPPEERSRPYLLYFAGRVAQLQAPAAPAGLCDEIATLAHEQFGLDETKLTEYLEALQPRIEELAGLLAADVGPFESLQTQYAAASEQLSRLAVEMSLDNMRVHEEKAQVEEGLRRAEAALQKKEEQLRQAQKMEALGRLAGGVAHDFNNLLTVINGYADFVLGMLDANHPSHRFLKEITRAGERAANLTRQLLAFSRKQVLQPRVLDLNNLVRDMEGMLRRLSGEQVALTLAPADRLPPVKADPGQLEQVVMNLVVNARDALPRGGRVVVQTGSVTIADGADGGPAPGAYVVLSVQDNGVGMSEPTLARIFEPFFTTKEGGKGTGLGLAVVHGIVTQSGGHLEVSSALDEGTCFRVYLPAVDPEPAAALAATTPAAALPTGTETVLLAEGEEGVRSLVRHTLARCGYIVLEAGDGAEALHLADSHAGPLHLLVTDLVLSVVGGRELAERLRTARPDLKVLFICGHADQINLVHERFPASGTHLLPKPFTPSILAQKIREVLG